MKVDKLVAVYGPQDKVHPYSSLEGINEKNIISGSVVFRSAIPKDLPLKVHQEYPIFIDVTTENTGLVRVHFNTNDSRVDSMDYLKEMKEQGFPCDPSQYKEPEQERGSSGTFKNQAILLENKIQVGDKIMVEVKEGEGAMRTAYGFIRLQKHKAEQVVSATAAEMSEYAPKAEQVPEPDSADIADTGIVSNTF